MTSDPSDWRGPRVDDLLEAIVALPDQEAAARFMRDLCTLRELHDLGQRWQVAQLLDQGRHYAEISRETGASTATITRIAQWLKHGTGGYREALERGAGIAAPESMTVPLDPDRLRLAVPNKGRLLDPTLQLLGDAGLRFESGSRALVAHAEEFPLDILFVRTEDVIEFVGDGVADLGITGTNLLVEAGAELPVLLELAYGRCRLEAATPNDASARSLEDLAGLRIATSHPQTARRFFAGREIPVEIVAISGSVEVAPRMGLADGIVDLVSSGSTLVMNGLRSVGVLLDSQAILVAGAKPDASRHAASVADFVTMLESVVAGRKRKYLMMNAPRAALEDIERLLPGLESPSIIPLAHEGMVAVHAVVGADEVWGLLPRLRTAGASGILVVPVEKLVP